MAVPLSSSAAHVPSTRASLAATNPVLRLASIVAATGLMALCSHISTVLPFTPVPTTMQTFGVLLIGMLLGPGAGFVTLVLYLCEGAVGLPVFSPIGAPGLPHLLGPTGGFLFSYPLAAFCAGLVFNALRRSMGSWFAALVAGFTASLPIFALGAAWLAVVAHQGLRSSVHLAVTPFLGGEVIKVALVSGVVTALHHARRSA